MNKKVKITAEQLKIELAKRQNDTWESIHIYLKRNKVFANKALREVFWNSNISYIHFESFTSELMFESYLIDYFTKVEEPNSGFIKKFLKTKQLKINILISVIKKTRAFENENHWSSFLVFERSNELIFKMLYKELLYIKSLLLKWESDSKPFILELQKYSYEEILLQCTAYFERVKRAIHSKNNFSKITSLRFSFTKVMNVLLNLKEKQTSNKFTKQNLLDYTDFVLPPIWHSEEMRTNQEPAEIKDDSKKIFRSIYDFFSKHNDINHKINLYLAGYADFESIDGFYSELVSNSKFIKYRKTLDKNTYDETYFTNSLNIDAEFLKNLKEVSDKYLKEIEMSTQSDLKYFEFLELRNNLTIKVSLEKILLFLKTFSLLLMPQRRLLLKNIKDGKVFILTKEIPPEFLMYFKSNYIYYFNIDELKEKVVTYFKFTNEELEEIIDLLSFDLCKSTKKEVDVDLYPLLKVGELVIWSSSFLRDMRWDVVLHRILSKAESINHNQQTKALETKIMHWFIDANYKSICSYKYRSDNGNGDIDIIAYKENTLILIELKNTYVIEDVLHTSKYNSHNFESKASDQLFKAKRYIRENFCKFKERFQIETSVDIGTYDSLKIQTIILSNSYVSDDIFFNNMHYKLSLFELMIILTNDRYNMLSSKIGQILYDIKVEMPIDVITGKNNETINKKDCNLWANKKECSISDFFSAIEENKVYNHMKQYEKKFNELVMELDKF